MRVNLFSFQEKALGDLHESIQDAHNEWREEKPQIISFNAPTGSGKTIIMTALFEEILRGYIGVDAEPDSIFVWLSDMPELNEQTRMKIESKSDKIRTQDIYIVDSHFDKEYFSPGCIYFLNTQKLGTDKLLTQEGDQRTYTIWETLANTSKRQPKSLYIVIDEAHRGTASQYAERQAQSIMQKFILGSSDDGMPIMPLVIGMTATPQRFLNMVSNKTKATIRNVSVSVADVRESGLLKEKVVIHYPKQAISADETMFKASVDNWKKKSEMWKSYCERENITKPVRPILVVQVEDGAFQNISRTDIGSCIRELKDSLGYNLKAGEVVHTFDTHDKIVIDGVTIHWIEASNIEDDPNVLVVFFKMSLSTGWDCPRAETMMSFRRASDETYIAQLLGRMIRTPLARRVEAYDELNNVSLFLPNFDEGTVRRVEQALQENEATHITEICSSRELVDLQRNPLFADVFQEMNLVTYRIDTTRKQPAIRRLMALARAVSQFGIDKNVLMATKIELFDEFSKVLSHLKDSGKYNDVYKAVTGFELRTLTIEYGSENEGIVKSTKTVDIASNDLDKLFERAGKVLGDGLHMDYWTLQVSIRKLVYTDREPKIEIIVLTNDVEAMKHLEKYADNQFKTMFDKYRPKFKDINEKRMDVFNKLAMSSSDPISQNWVLPLEINISVSDEAQEYENHLYIPSDGTAFKTILNNWERDLLLEEMKRADFIAWFRNLPQKKWSLEIPYEVSGEWTSMFPDLLVVRKCENRYMFDILEPHDSSRKDNYPKAVGLAKFSDKHGGDFGRIQLIRKERGADGVEHFLRLDMNKMHVRDKVRGVTSNEELDRIFEETGEMV